MQWSTRLLYVAPSDLIWFLLPVAAAAGWYAAKRNDSRRPEAYWNYASNFHQGLNVLLGEQQENSIELFDDLSDTSRETADTHITLGNLFRRRGDIDRAILLHESVINKETLADEVRATARFELAKDYDSAGLLDRSETVFRQLIESGHRIEDAYRCLLDLHEREHDWQQAIVVANECESVTHMSLGSQVAHYYCELAVIAGNEARADDAGELLIMALKHHPECARALMMQAALALESSQHDRALQLFEHVENLRPELMPEIIQQRFMAFKAIQDKDRLMQFIKRISAQRNAYSVIRSTREVIAELQSVELAERFFKDQILKRPSLKGLRDWARDQLALSKPGEREKVKVICNLLDQVVEDKPAYRCISCGFQGNVMHWRCPGCGTWDSVSTIIGVEGE